MFAHKRLPADSRPQPAPRIVNCSSRQTVPRLSTTHSLGSRRHDRAASSSCVSSSASVNRLVHSWALPGVSRPGMIGSPNDTRISGRGSSQNVYSIASGTKIAFSRLRGERAKTALQPERSLAHVHEAPLRRDPNSVAGRGEDRAHGAQKFTRPRRGLLLHAEKIRGV